MFAIKRRFFVAVLAVLLVAASAFFGTQRRASAAGAAKTVIVELRGDPVVVAEHRAESEGRDFDALAYRQRVVAEQDAFLSRAGAVGITYTVAGVNAPNLSNYELKEFTDVFTGIVPASDAGLERAAGVTYVDVPFTSKEKAIHVRAELRSSLGLPAQGRPSRG